MAEYLNRAELQEALQRKKPVIGSNARFTEGYNDAILRIKSMVSKFPAADVTPVVHGKWIEAWIEGICHYKCSECSEYTEETWHANFVYNYCPNCGAKMDGGKA